MIRVLYFGSIAERVGRRESSLDPDAPLTLAGLLRATGCEAMQPLLLAVNREHEHDLQRLLQDGDEVAIMPPFSGG